MLAIDTACICAWSLACVLGRQVLEIDSDRPVVRQHLRLEKGVSREP